MSVCLKREAGITIHSTGAVNSNKSSPAQVYLESMRIDISSLSLYIHTQDMIVERRNVKMINFIRLRNI